MPSRNNIVKGMCIITTGHGYPSHNKSVVLFLLESCFTSPSGTQATLLVPDSTITGVASTHE